MGELTDIEKAAIALVKDDEDSGSPWYAVRYYGETCNQCGADIGRGGSHRDDCSAIRLETAVKARQEDDLTCEH